MGNSSVDVTSEFNKIYESTANKALAYISAKCGNPDDVGDILQETYMELYSVMLDKGCGFIDNEEAFVIDIAKKKIYKHYTALERKKADLSLTMLTNDNGEVNLDIAPEEFDIDDSLCTKELVEEISETLKTKSKEIRKIFFMRFSLDLPINEIAQLLGTNESNVKNKLYRTIKELREIYAGKGEFV